MCTAHQPLVFSYNWFEICWSPVAVTLVCLSTLTALCPSTSTAALPPPRPPNKERTEEPKPGGVVVGDDHTISDRKGISFSRRLFFESGNRKQNLSRAQDQPEGKRWQPVCQKYWKGASNSLCAALPLTRGINFPSKFTPRMVANPGRPLLPPVSHLPRNGGKKCFLRKIWSCHWSASVTTLQTEIYTVIRCLEKGFVAIFYFICVWITRTIYSNNRRSQVKKNWVNMKRNLLNKCAESTVKPR